MDLLRPHDTPKHRLKFVFLAGGLFLGMLILWWAYEQYWRGPIPVRTVELPFRTEAIVEEHFGVLDGEGYRTVQLRRGEVLSKSFRFSAGEWPLACEFLADADKPEEMTVLHLGVVQEVASPGDWLKASDLSLLDEILLPRAVTLLDHAVIE